MRLSKFSWLFQSEVCKFPLRLILRRFWLSRKFQSLKLYLVNHRSIVIKFIRVCTKISSKKRRRYCNQIYFLEHYHKIYHMFEFLFRKTNMEVGVHIPILLPSTVVWKSVSISWFFFFYNGMEVNVHTLVLSTFITIWKLVSISWSLFFRHDIEVSVHVLLLSFPRYWS